MNPLALITTALVIWLALCALWVIIGILTPDHSRTGLDNGTIDISDDERTRP